MCGMIVPISSSELAQGVALSVLGQVLHALPRYFTKNDLKFTDLGCHLGKSISK